MVLRLSRGSSFTLSRISEGLGITRQGARKHLEVLRRAQVVTLAPSGRDVLVQLDPASLVLVKDFVSTMDKQWDTRMERLKQFVEED
jgi:DNA-binding transcriptional ArsR family regulator